MSTCRSSSSGPWRYLTQFLFELFALCFFWEKLCTIAYLWFWFLCNANFHLISRWFSVLSMGSPRQVSNCFCHAISVYMFVFHFS